MHIECILISNKHITKIEILNFDWNYFKIFTRLSQKRFKQLVERLLQFISLRLFPAKPEEFPPITKCSWWIPSASKVLALLSRFYSIIFTFLLLNISISISKYCRGILTFKIFLRSRVVIYFIFCFDNGVHS